MPNWCQNAVEFRHENPYMISRLRAAQVRANAGEHGFFQEFVPSPLHASVFGNVDLTWAENNWGASIDEESVEDDGSNGDLDISFSFLTAWNPPIVFYDKMVELGFVIDAIYAEQGNGLAGKYTNEHGHEAYGVNSSRDYEDLPGDVQHYFGSNPFSDDEYSSDSIVAPVGAVRKFIKIASPKVREEMLVKMLMADASDHICSACLADHNDETFDPVKVIVTTCNHAFHRKCLKEWVKTDTSANKLCPLCRTLVVASHSDEPDSQETGATPSSSVPASQ
jgi:hypothetical protein